jgi:hypothetical protein
MASAMGVLALATLGLTASAAAQPKRGQFIGGEVGYGLSAPYQDDAGSDGHGGLVQAEYTYAPNAWVGVRPYAAVIVTWPDSVDGRCESAELAWDCEVTAQGLMLGGKGRLAIPIPYVAPFLELGMGATLGSVTTRTFSENHQVTGALVHIPVTLGVAIGEDHDFELAFAYYFHPAARQFNGGITCGMSFRLE